MSNQENKEIDKDYQIHSQSTLSNGPIENRSVTDCLCCLIFLGFIVVSVLVVGYGFIKGDASKLAIPYDPDHRGCGYDEGVKDFPYIYFASPYPGYLWRTVCVKECPKQGETALKCAPNSEIKECEGVKISKETEAKELSLFANNLSQIILTEEEFESRTSTQLLSINPTKTYVYASKPYLGVVCIPQAKTFFEQIKSVISFEKIDKVMKDIKGAWLVILIGSIVALLACVLFIAGMRCAAGAIIYLIIFLFNALFALLGVFLIHRAGAFSEVEQSNSSKTAYYVAGGICLLITLVCLVLICWFRKRIQLAVAIMKTSSQFVTANISIIFFPLLCFIIILLFVVYWIVAALYLYSIGEPSKKPHQFPFGQIHHNEFIRNLGIFHIVALFWVIAFISSACDFVIACASAIWYYNWKENNKACIRTSIKWLFVYHIGSVAFASAILAIVWMLQCLFEYMAQQIEKSGATENGCVKCLLWCGRCCLKCFERFIRFINQGAFTQMGMTGKGFCASCKDAFGLMLRNPIRFSLVAGLAEMFTLLGKAFVVALSVFISYLLLTQVESFNEKVSSVVVPLILVAVISFMIGAVFIQIYGQSAETLLMVFVIDEEVQRIHFNRTQPEHAPPALQDFFTENTKQ